MSSAAPAAIRAIQAGDVDALDRLLNENPGLASERIVRGRGQLTLLHVVTDWPGHFPNGPKTVARLVAAGGDVNARFAGPNNQTPLHWAASSNDVEVLDALLDAGADIEAPGAFNGVGGPLDNAVGFGQWATARRLVERGARTSLWHAAALGMIDRLRELFADAQPGRDKVTEALWQACHGGQLQAAKYLVERGGDLNWIGYDESTPLDIARRSNENVGSPPPVVTNAWPSWSNGWKVRAQDQQGRRARNSKRLSPSRDEPYSGEPCSAALESRIRGPQLEPAQSSQRDIESVAGG